MGAGADDAFAAWDAGDADVEEAAEEEAERAANDEEGFHWLSIGLLAMSGLSMVGRKMFLYPVLIAVNGFSNVICKNDLLLGAGSSL